jgi:hypothetical protein
MKTQDPLTTTAGSLGEQFSNAEASIAPARQSRGGGFEAIATSGLVFVTWNPAEEAALEILDRTLTEALDPGDHTALEHATEELTRAALLGRTSLRDAVVLRLVEPAQVAVQKQLSLAIAGMTVANAAQTCATIVRNTYAVVEQLRARIEAELDAHLTESAILGRIDAAAREGTTPLALLMGALGRVGGGIPDAIARAEQDSRDAQRIALEQEQLIRIRATEAGRATLFGRDRVVQTMVREVTTSIPKLTNERIAAVYLPAVRNGMPAIARCCEDRRTQLDARRNAVLQARTQLQALSAEVSERQAARGRVRIVGAPRTEATRRAAIETVVEAVLPSIRKELRDLIIYKAPATRLLEELLAVVRTRLRSMQPARSIDEALLDGQDPAAVAVALDREIQDAGLPLGLVPDADRHRLRALRCRVLRVPPGSRVAAALVEHARYPATEFAETAALDTIEVLLWQPGIHVADTRIFHGGEEAWHGESADPSVGPLQTLAPALLAALRKTEVEAEPTARPAEGRRRARDADRPHAEVKEGV